jgi:hypothetical protein
MAATLCRATHATEAERERARRFLIALALVLIRAVRPTTGLASAGKQSSCAQPLARIEIYCVTLGPLVDFARFFTQSA